MTEERIYRQVVVIDVAVMVVVMVMVVVFVHFPVLVFRLLQNR